LGRNDFKAGLLQLAWKHAQRSVPMTLFLLTQWLGYTDKQQGDLTLPPIPLESLEHISEEATVLLWAAKQVNKSAKDKENGNK
jgi:hypothetical protein